MKRFTKSALALTLALGLVGSANAGLLPVNVTVTPDGDNYRFTYGVVLTSDSVLTNGDFFTIYDFEGFVPDTAVIDSDFDFSFSANNVGDTPPLTTPSDDPEIPNLTFTYEGDDLLAGSVGLGNFSAISTLGSTKTGEFAALSRKQIDPDTEDSNITEAQVPATLSDPPEVPEPATLTLLAVGGLAGAAGYRRRAKKATA